MCRFLIALVFAAIAISPAASQAQRSDTSGTSIARREPRSHRGEARSEARKVVAELRGHGTNSIFSQKMAKLSVAKALGTLAMDLERSCPSDESSVHVECGKM